jgi:uncharacterized membrane protein
MRNATDILFRIGLIVKGIDSLFEVAGGVLLTMPTKLARYITLLSEHEAFRHHQALAGRLDNLADSVTQVPHQTQAIYLTVHGLVKVVLIGAIFFGKKWAYTGLIWILSLFALVEITQAVVAREVVTGGLALFDVAVVVLIYKERKARFPEGIAAPSPGAPK